jgi:hypothetical protein
MCAIGRSLSNAKRTPRWTSSSGYFFGRAMARETPLPPGHHPGFKASVEPGTADLLKIWPALWTFADHGGIEPTNNHAKRALRSAVIYRKLSLGSQSDGGERRIERLLSAHTTCRLQRRSLHTYLIDAIGAHTRGDPVPLLT